MASFAFKIGGIEPRHDPAWMVADEPTRRAYWQAVVGFVKAIKDKELAAGLDRFGEPLHPIAESTRAKGRWRSHTGMGSAEAPPLDPAYRMSRTRSLFDGRAKLDHAEFFWRLDEVTGLPWGQVLSWHRAGKGRLPVRDVIGLSPQSLAEVKARANAWWASHKSGRKSVEQAATIKFVAQAPKTIPLTGRTDLHNATFGIGTDGERSRRAIDAGQATGFRQLGPRPSPPKATASVPVPRPSVPGMPGRVAASPRPDLSIKPRIPKAPPAPAPTPTTGPGRFAADVLEAARSIPEAKRFGGDKTFIHHAYGAYIARHGEIPYDEFKRRLLEAHAKGKVELSRADMVEAMSATNVRLSHTAHPMGATFNFVRVPEAPKLQAPAGSRASTAKAADASPRPDLSVKPTAPIPAKPGESDADRLRRELREVHGSDIPFTIDNAMTGTGAGYANETAGIISTDKFIKYVKEYDHEYFSKGAGDREKYVPVMESEIKGLTEQLKGKKGKEKKALLSDIAERTSRLDELRHAKQTFVWQSETTPERRLSAVLAHEVGHSIEFRQSLQDGLDFRAAIRTVADGLEGGRIPRKDLLEVSVYGASHPSELLGEIHALYTLGRRHDVPKPLRDAYDTFMADFNSRRPTS